MIMHDFNPKRTLPSGLDLDVHALEPAVDPEIEELYRFVVDCWRHDDVSQSGVMSRKRPTTAIVF
jgi:hypothetical protein